MSIIVFAKALRHLRLAAQCLVCVALLQTELILMTQNLLRVLVLEKRATGKRHAKSSLVGCDANRCIGCACRIALLDEVHTFVILSGHVKTCTCALAAVLSFYKRFLIALANVTMLSPRALRVADKDTNIVADCREFGRQAEVVFAYGLLRFQQIAPTSAVRSTLAFV